MDQFLFELAEMKYRMYHELFKFNPSAYTAQECFERIKYDSMYKKLLDIIGILPVEQARKLTEIEREYFSDAPYVYKNN